MTTNKSDEFETKLSRANQGLASARCRVKIIRRGQSLYLRGTLPPKPGSSRTKAFQQEIALGVKATHPGLQRATAEAKKISAALDLKEFNWTTYFTCGKKPAERKTMAEWRDIHFQQYFQDKEQTPTRLRSYRFDYHRYFKRLPQDQVPCRDLLEQTIRAAKPDSCTRLRMCIAYRSLCQVIGIDPCFIDKKLQGNYSRFKPAPRHLPSDETIVEWFNKISDPGARWIYGMIATYGLRPHEIFHLNIERLEKGGYIVEVLENTKTGYREVLPLHPEWVDQFELRTKCFPKYRLLDRPNSALGAKVGSQLRSRKIPFPAYNLRHRYAVRCIDFNVPVSLAARWMGHSVEIHTKIYQLWMEKELEEQIFKRLINDPRRPSPPSIQPVSLDRTESTAA